MTELKPSQADFGELQVCNPRRVCAICQGRRKLRGNCSSCSDGYELTYVIKDMWSCPSFLVCGGPSLNDLDLDKLKDRGIVSLGVNNVAGHAPVDAWVFSDPQTKFHHGLFLDPKVLTFCPTPKLRKHVRAKLGDTFRETTTRVDQCPSTVGFQRSGRLYPEHFFETWFAQWGFGGRQGKEHQPFRRLCTMLLGLRLLHYLGSREVYLLGVDFWIDKSEPYAFSQAKGGGNNAWRKNEEMLRLCLPSFAKHDFRVYNCNARSHLELFEHVSYEDALSRCRGNVPEEPFDLADWYTKSVTRRHRELHPKPIKLGT